MRAAAEKYLAEFPGFVPVKGTSDHTTLPDTSVDMIVAAEHSTRSTPKSHGPSSNVSANSAAGQFLIWNIRQEETTPFLVEYEELIRKYSIDYHVVRHNNITDKEIGDFLGTEFEVATFDNVQVFDLAGLLGRLKRLRSHVAGQATLQDQRPVRCRTLLLQTPSPGNRLSPCPLCCCVGRRDNRWRSICESIPRIRRGRASSLPGEC